jgi:hypothetical protein
MKKLITSAAQLLALTVFCYSCKEETPLSPETSKIELTSAITNLNLQIQYPDSGNYDSAYIVFRNTESEIKESLILNNATYTAIGVVPNIGAGSWYITASFFRTITTDYQSLEKTGDFSVDITRSATDLIADESSAFINDGSYPIKKTIRRREFYYYQMYSAGSSAPEGFVRLPADPADPFVEVATFSPKWIYAYVDRSFYNRNADGTSNHYQGGSAFETYGTHGITYDRLESDIIDTTSLASGISEVVNKEWNYVDCLVMIEGTTPGQSILIYHVWDLRSSNGRISRPDAAIWHSSKIEKRKKVAFRK